MNLSALIESIDKPNLFNKEASAPKTAAAKTAGAEKPAIDAAVTAALQVLAVPKLASEQNPTLATPATDLQKMAAEQVEQEKQAELQHSYMLGMAMADGFVQSLNQHRDASEKVAGEQATAIPEGYTAEDFQLVKMAKENPAEFLQLVQQGFNQQMGTVKQSADEVYTQTYNEVVNGIHKLASDHYLTGYTSTIDLIKELASGA